MPSGEVVGNVVRVLDFDISDWFGQEGPLAAAVPGYTLRDAQIQLAQAVDETIASHSVLVAEAGTGTGKTWAYLIPAFLSGGKVLISTGTRTLQDQLFSKDVPRVRDALALPVQVALLKGRSNYVCHFHLDRLEQDERALKSRDEIAQLRQIRVFATRSRSGDKTDCGQVPEDADIWNRVTSTRENCLGQDCPNVKECFLLKARRQAQEADVVVINHALFFADLVLREEGITDLLPAADAVVFDEAHQLPDTATRFMGDVVYSGTITDFLKAAEVAALAYARDSAKWTDACQRVSYYVKDLRLAAAPIENMPGRKATFEQIPDADRFFEILNKLYDELVTLTGMLTAVQERHPDLAAAAKSGTELCARLYRWSQPVILPEGVSRDSEQAAAAERAVPADPSKAVAGVAEQLVRWVEVGMHHFRLQMAPLSVADAFSRQRRKDQAWIFTSATLSLYKDFSHYTRQLGLYGARTEKWESPFDYQDHAMLYVPDHLPEPQSPDFQKQFVTTLIPLIQASPGGVLVLCTTLRAVDNLSALLLEAFDTHFIERPVLRQGESSRGTLLEQFRQLKNAVLVGSASFWEGIDLPGEMLTLVAIDKLPFAPPDDPVLEARIKACREDGGNPFFEFQLPSAAIALKQGAGRLIRTEKDWGLLVVGDRRLVEKPYGKLLWRGLPPFRRTRKLDEATDFLKSHAKDIAVPKDGDAAA
ncbi:putative ATP-dependent helicase [Advenella mimigardefordensis DPN7]|uniref:DNA 5'-3' helicase n=1 Tax=Advenella mimigardefordensis (strain DSM 17166 / LMG 22922 / DPN7) TaxID=1247726 RepID=W0P9N1_ADVMD|nr:putative ATP-dependent helicase [Advenella mimigardefordensis DPN7]